jgi:flavin-dependent thymidylate synthase
MKILLAGYNIDYDVIRTFKAKSKTRQDLTPETISAAYARISRSPKPVHELREIAREEVDQARQSNRNIVFDMGHSSIAEHAVFNIDVVGVSRLLVEEIEKFRLCSFTEKSQRYVLFKKDFIIPEEIQENGLTDTFVSAVDAQNDFYHSLYEKLRPYIFEKYPTLADHPANQSMLEGWAKEDARYVISMATQTQLGMTINARNLELMLRRLAALPLTEARDYSDQLYDATKQITPSLIRYTRATDYDKLTRKNLRRQCQHLSEEYGTGLPKSSNVQLIYSTPDADNQIAASLLFSSSNIPYAMCLKMAGNMTPRTKKSFIKTAFANLQPHDAVLREMENVSLQFELILSSSCFAQIKRHRMATIITQEYNPELGVTIPPSIQAIGRQKDFTKIMRMTQKAYEHIKQKIPEAAPYVLTNAHRKRILMKFNAREMYHLARLRADAHAQWDIRDLTEKMLSQARKAMPLTLMLACGKNHFPEVFKKAFPGKP